MSLNYKIINPKRTLESFEQGEIAKYILSNRDIPDPQEYLNLDDSYIYSYELLENIEDAKNLFLEHINKKSKIGIICDSDVDGYVSSSILYNYIKNNNLFQDIKVFFHKGKQHGIGDLLDQIIDSEIGLLLVPDAGINDVKECEKLKNKNIDVIILDHHQVEVENHYAVVVNNQLGEYPNKYLSGAGVTKKFLECLDDELWLDSSEYDDVVAISIVADSMSILEYENKRLVSKGLSKITNNFIKAIIEKQSYSLGGQNININAISFYIAPLINALIRSGSLDDKKLMFRAFIDDPELFEYKKRSGEIVEETIYDKVARLATNLKAKQNREIDKSLEILRDKIQVNEWDKNKILFVDADGVDWSYTGLVATKLCNEYQRPCLLIRQSKDNTFAGSARNYGNQIENLKDYLLDTGMFEYAQGHQSAMGIGIKIKNIKPAIEELNKRLEKVNFGESVHYIDFEINANELIVPIIEEMNTLYDHYGNGINESLVLVKNIFFNTSDVETMGKTSDTWKFLLNNEIEFIKFKNNSDDVILRTMEEEWGGKDLGINAVCKLSISEFGGVSKPQCLVVGYEVI